MHIDRATQFSVRLRWDVTVDRNGEEHDEYDSLDPLYVIIENYEGKHEGSLRLLPTTGRTMVNEHFLELTNGVKISSPHIWECTRFCISPTADRRTAARLLASGAFLMKECCIDHFVGVFDDKMERVYRALGSSPTVLGRRQTKNGKIGVGLWEFNEPEYQKMLQSAKVSEPELAFSFENNGLVTHNVALPDTQPPAVARL
ncbi:MULTISPECIES: acyl-homoserine-lactone synthase [unclassified Roseovarius]|uniref:acyl-homoserine-lactone synthase n=1 Tax=unclassified Roseovarius TaxID=2614913 RepID=UPI00273ECA76|nr:MULTISPECIES: acyl-homoserine-lactone synthase [unclassified Roseovarius]